MGAKVAYDGAISGAAIVAATAGYSLSGANVYVVPYANGMRVLIFTTG